MRSPIASMVFVLLFFYGSTSITMALRHMWGDFDATVPIISNVAASSWCNGIHTILVAVPLLASHSKKLGTPRRRHLVWIAVLVAAVGAVLRWWALSLPRCSELIAS